MYSSNTKQSRANESVEKIQADIEMTLNLVMPDHDELKPKITVFGVGGAGGNAVNNMIEKQLDGVDFVVANTDAQALQQNHSTAKVQMGVRVTEGLGAGARPAVGAAAAEETIEEIVDHLVGSHMCFITAGMGGGTGTGAAPIIAQAARELGVLTVGVVTKPFQFEGSKRMRKAEEGVENLQKVVDTLIIIPNQNLFRLANEKTTFTEAFSLADDVLYQGVKGVTDLMVRPGLINLDFADVRAVMDEMGKAMMGTGEGEGEDRAIQAAEKAIANPLLDEISLKGAKGVLINITGGHDLTLFELDEAANRIREEVDPDANIIVGSTLDSSLEGAMRVSVVATGIDAVAKESELPLPRRRLAEPLTNQVAAEPVEETAAVAAEAPAPQSYEPVEAVVATPPAAAVAAVQEEPTLFQDLAPQAGAQPQTSVVEDDLPPPAYDPERTVAAGRAAPGTPTPEALARLQAAVNRQPQGYAPRQAAAPAAAHAQASHADQDAAQGSRFGINSLINRMTGHAADPARPQQASVNLHQDEALEPDDDMDRIEIPAFLRRQAN